MHVVSTDETINIAVQYYQNGHLEQSERICQELLQSESGHPKVFHLLGAIAYKRKQYNKAIELIYKAIEGDPRIPQFYNTLGAVLRVVGRFEEAITAYKQAVSIKPDYAEAYNNMGNVFLSRRLYSDAVDKYNQAIVHNPGDVEAYNSMAVALQYLGEYITAIEMCNKALMIKPDYAQAYNTIASVLLKKGCHNKAIDNYKQALDLKPDYAQAHTNLGMALLLCGRFEEGWAEYKWRLNINNTVDSCNKLSRWDGSSFAGKRLLVRYEQGFGDNIQFIRYLPMVKDRGGTVICQMLRPLVGLLRGFPGIDELIDCSLNNQGEVFCDFYIPLMDLPGMFGTTLETIPGGVPYLHADPDKAEQWREKLAGPDFKVGIVWAGKSVHTEDNSRSCQLNHFLPLSKIPNVRLFSLQKGQAAGQVRDLSGNIPIINLADEFFDFTDTAAAIENLDLVISVDTAVLHLAGAMGKPVWAVLPFTPDWRWMLDRQDSPWYPTMRLFRQKELAQWGPVFENIGRELEILASRHELRT